MQYQHTKTTTQRRPWVMLRHANGSDYGPGAYSLFRHGKQHAVVIHDGLEPDEVRLIAAAPRLKQMLRDVLALYAQEFSQHEPINGADFLEVFTEWRGKALRIMHRDALI